MTKPSIPKKIPRERPERIAPGIPVVPRRHPERPEREPTYIPEPNKPEKVSVYAPGLSMIEESLYSNILN
ncbi:MAG: hypothetical protein Q8P81_04405 [Nanoarchaeota archaeon]|nr:hypothetical protein [Nanoarchaeota archaeon]